jgi:hypothetical protein
VRDRATHATYCLHPVECLSRANDVGRRIFVAHTTYGEKGRETIRSRTDSVGLFRSVYTLGCPTSVRLTARRVLENQSASKNFNSGADSYSSGPS